MAAVSLTFPSFESEAAVVAGRICGTGEMASAIRRFDWSRTPLGELSSWPDEVVCLVNLVLGSPLASCLCLGPELTLIFNDAYRAVTGTRRLHALGGCAAKVYEETWGLVGPEYARVMKGGTIHREKALFSLRERGEMRDFYFNYSLSPVYAGGSIVGVYTTSADVTETVLAAAERDRLGQRVKQVLSSTSDGVVTIDREWRVTYLNEAASKTFASIPGMVGRNVRAGLGSLRFEALEKPEEGWGPKAHFVRAMEESVAAEFDAYYPEPLKRWFRMRVSPTPEGIAVFFQDVTEAKRSQELAAEAAAALAASEDELRWTVALSAQMPWTADTNGLTLNSEQRVGGLDGRVIEGSEGDNWHRLIHPEDLPGVKAKWASALATGQPYDMEHRVRTKDGEYRWYRSRAQPRRDAEGRIVKWYGTTEDIEVRKRTEEALRTSEKLAVVGRMASSIAHEINNPLEAVTNLVYLARTGEAVPEETREYLEAADRELRRASAITSQTLRFHRQSSRPTKVALESLLSEVFNLLHGKLLNSGVRLESRMLAERPLCCMEGEIRQVLLNLTDNAVEAMHGQGGGRLMLRTRASREWSTGRCGVTITVADTGRGMSTEVRGRLFDPFFTTKGDAGTGLGLWLSQEIVERHGGSMRLRSRQGGDRSGSVFTVFLPEDMTNVLPRGGCGSSFEERRVGGDRRASA